MDSNIGHQIEKLRDLRRRKKEAEFALKQIEGDIGLAEMEIMQRMDDLDITASKSAIGSVSITESVVPQVEDWGAAYEDLAENDLWKVMLQKRMAVLPYRELLSNGKVLRGVQPFTKRKLTFREA